MSGAKNVLFEEDLAGKFCQVSLEASAVDGLVFFAIMEGLALFFSEESRKILDCLRAPDSRLGLDGIKDIVDGKSHRSEMLFHPEGS